jgi:hypothetical protein
VGIKGSFEISVRNLLILKGGPLTLNPTQIKRALFYLRCGCVPGLHSAVDLRLIRATPFGSGIVAAVYQPEPSNDPHHYRL